MNRWSLSRDTRATLLLLLLVALAYSGAGQLGFVNFDDPLYVTKCDAVRAGLSWEGVRWAFTSMTSGNWHPLTWLSHMLDVSLFGVRPGPAHWVNVLIHALNAALLFRWLQKCTGAFGPSLMVAILFAVHPAHVESVAWISERKDLLSTLLGLLALLAYHQYAKQPSPRRMMVVALWLCLGLMAKAMLVTFPALFLLLDVWPYGRAIGTWRARWGLFQEKLPLFVLVAAHALVTLVAQSKGGAVASLAGHPLTERLGNALLGYVRYVGLALYPLDLVVFYPMPSTRVLWIGGGVSGMALGVVTALLWRFRRRNPCLLFGWAWFLLTLLPVIGLVQVGGQSIADRYTYLPLVGPLLAGACGAKVLLDRWGVTSRVRGLIASLLVLGLLPLTRAQVAVWKDSESLFRHALAHTSNNHLALLNLGEHLTSQGRHQEALPIFREASALAPTSIVILRNLGTALLGAGQLDESISLLRRVVRLDPKEPKAHAMLAEAFLRQGKAPEAAHHCSEYLRLVLSLYPAGTPKGMEASVQRARMVLGFHFRAQGDPLRASLAFRDVVLAHPGELTARINLALCLLDLRLSGEAAEVLQEGLRRGPAHPQLLEALARVYLDAGDHVSAASVIGRLQASHPGHAALPELERRLRGSGPRR